MCAVVLGVVACTQKDDQGRIILDAPKITIEGNTVSWDPVDNAEKYGVLVDGKEEIVTKTGYIISTDKDNVVVKVRALGDDIKTVSSAYSNEVTFTKGERLDTPKMNEPKIDGDEFQPNKVTFSWGAVDGATKYKVSVNGKDKGIVTGTEYVMSAEDLKEVGVYKVSVKAVSDDSKVAPSALSESSTFYKKQKLVFGTEENDIPHYDGSSISWHSVTGAQRYRVYVTKDGEQKELKSTSSTSISAEEIDQYIKQYNTDDDGNVNEAGLAGDYQFSIQPYNKDKETLYVAQDPVPVKDKEGKEVITLKKSPAVQNVAISGSQITWSALDGQSDVKYVVTLTSGDLKDSSNLVYKDITATSLDLKEKEGFKQYYGRVFEVTVQVQADSEKAVLNGVESKATSKLCISPEALELKENVYQIDSAADFVYMLEHADTAANYKLVSDIDFGGAQIYATGKYFGGTFDGADHIIKNVEFVSNGGDVQLFSVIAGEFKNVTFVNAKVNSDKDVYFLTGENRGIIEKVYMLNCDIHTTGNEASLVGTNAKTINNVGLVQSNISAKAKVAGVAITNNDTIFNPSIVNNSTIKIDIEREGEEASTSQNQLFAAGVACENNGTITHAVVYRATISIRYDVDNEVTAYVGGIAGKNTDKINTSYIDGDSKTNKVLSIGVGKDEDKQYIGGMAGYMTGGEVSSTYVYKMTIDNFGFAGGIVGQVDSGIVKNSYVATTKIDGKVNGSSAMIANGSVGGFTNNYFRKDDSPNCKLDGGRNMSVNDGYGSFTDLVRKDKLEGFVLMPNKVEGETAEIKYVEISVLNDLIYVDKYAITTAISTESKEESTDKDMPISAFAGGKKLDNQCYIAADNTTGGDKLDFVINKLADGRQVILPIYNSIK